MRPELDTKNPPGQQVNVPKEHLELSDYIRSINRREALDVVASEKKLTFDEWYITIRPKNGGMPWDDWFVCMSEAFKAGMRCGKAPQERSE